MSKSIKVLGMNTQHDGGCCLIIDGEIACAISEERLTRKKGAEGWLYSLMYCLETTQTSLNEIDLVTFSCYGDPLAESFDGGLARLGFSIEKCQPVDHHLSHAYSTFMVSPFERALIVILDGSGNSGDTESYYIGSGNRIEKFGDNKHKETFRGIGKAYEAFTNFLGWTMSDSGKTMGLAAFGRDRVFKAPLFEIDGSNVNSKLKRKYARGVIDFAKENGLEFGEPFAKGETQNSKDVAFYIQDQIEKALVQIIRHLIAETGEKNLCLAGGVALNCVANKKILDETGVEKIFITPAASDKGQALGNALFGYHHTLKRPRITPITDDSFGRNYSNDEILSTLERRPELGGNFIVHAPEIDYKFVPNIARVSAEMISKGNLIGWLQGGSELGPRALGHRSILGDPRSQDTVHKLNTKVKFRESFRPYAPSVLIEHSKDYFELECDSPFMLLAAKVREARRSLIPAVVHVDGTARVQTVSRDDRRLYYDLISEFYKITGIPILLNTSFNIAGEPIVETPRDALNCFLRTKMDYLVMGNYIIGKRHD
jgi:carbamoyltransferase